MYCNAQDIRDLLGVEIGDAPDNIINKYILKAQKIVMKHIQIPVVNEEMSGEIKVDASNNTFTAENGFWANTTGSLGVGTIDFQVYLWSDPDDEFTKSQAIVSSFDSTSGKVRLATAPDYDTYKKITIDYSYYTCKVDWDLISLATAYYAAMMYVGREFYLVPERVFLGEMRLQRTKGEPWETLRREFRRVVDLLVAAPMDTVTYTKMVINPRRSTAVDSEEGTLAQQMDLV